MNSSERDRASAFGPLPTARTGAPAPGVRATLFPAFDAAAPEAGVDAASVEEARRTAYDEGVAAGKALAREEIGLEAEAFVAAVQEVAGFRGGLLARYQKELLELALGIARKVVQRELAEHPEHWLGMIRDAVGRVLDRERIGIRVGEVLHRYLVEHLPSLRALLDDVRELDLIEDATLPENGCVLESATGEVDLSIDSQMGAIRAALREPE